MMGMSVRICFIFMLILKFRILVRNWLVLSLNDCRWVDNLKLCISLNVKIINNRFGVGVLNICLKLLRFLKFLYVMFSVMMVFIKCLLVVIFK